MPSNDDTQHQREETTSDRVSNDVAMSSNLPDEHRVGADEASTDEGDTAHLSLNNCMPWRVTLILILLTITAHALHTNTFAVFELKEQLQMLYMNMWELLLQLEYVTADQRIIVYQEIEHIKQQIVHTIDLLKQHDQQQHP